MEVNNKNNNNKDKLVKYTFYLTYAFLLTTGTITFIESMRTNIPKIRHILNLETCISVVAAFFYSQFMKRLEQGGETINYKQINETRYTDWAITTPIMLLVLVLAILYNTGGSLNFFDFLLILLFNYIMLASGYLGEIGKITKRQGVIIGFIGFILLYGFIYAKYMTRKYIFDNQMIFWAFVILWAIYGLIYEADEQKRNVGYNILDLFSKCFVGIFFWAYFTKTFTLK